MKSKIVLLIINLILLTGVGSVFCQGSSEDLAQKHFDRGMVIIETAKSNDDFKAAISEFESAKIYLNNWADAYYNLGLLYDKLEMYSNSIKNYKAYIQLAPDAEDSEEVKILINKIEYKAEQFSNPETLTGIWYSSRPKYWSEPRLEIRINNGVVEASALVMEVAVDDLPAGEFVPLLWDSKESTLTVKDAPYSGCDQGIDPEWCPHFATFYLKRTGENTLEGEQIVTGRVYTYLDKPETLTKSGKVVFTREIE